MDIGQKIKNARLQKGYTQRELGEILGVQNSAIAKYESGRVVNIKRSVLVKISKALDMPPAELITDYKIEERKTGIILDNELTIMVSEYNQLDNDKKAQVREYVHLLLVSSMS